ncbi:hypothetical protein HC251_01880 [Iamia sp. SCSIO 61187]|nr:hypothetical protein HC251_01880 [Iamia sp. SCSIO 61187]
MLALAAVGCGGDDDSGDGGDGGGGGSDTSATGALADVDFEGAAITVGSKDFDESILLGTIMVTALEETGADVTDSTNTGGTNVARDALLNGDIDVYPEYNGTGWTEHLGNEDPSDDPTELYEVVRDADLEQNDIHWLGSSEFNNTYGFATSSDFVEENNDGEPFTFETMAAHLEENPDATVCMETEFPDRSDGLVLWEEETGYEIPESQITILDTNVIYTETANGTCDFGEIFTTDGRIGGLELVLVEDPGAMIIYNVSYTVRDDAYSENPEAWDTVAEAILEGLDQDTMNELNARVSFEGEDVEDVARDYLVDQGLIEG